jgi:hypothetical protein
MKSTYHLLLALVLFSGLAFAFAAQTLEKIPETNFTRETELDADGHQQFKAYDVKCEACRGRGTWDCRGCFKRELPDCSECGGTQKAPCRDCAGTGKLLDPLVELPCPYCRGSAWYDCALCAGGGEIIENRPDGESTRKPCGACKQVGRYPCVVCEGTRKLPSIRVKKKAPTEAKLKDLEAVREELLAVQAGLESFEPLGRAAKSAKELNKLLSKPSRTLPPLKDMQDLLETVEKGLVKAGSGYANFEERQDHHFRVFRDRSIYLVRHSIRVLDLCIARAEFNEGVGNTK